MAYKRKSKAEKARGIFNKMTEAGKARKDIINAFKSRIGLTDEGAKTYYYNCSKDNTEVTN